MDGATRAAVLALGEQIAAGLDEHDLLSRWMAHHLAERLTTLETLRGRAKATAEAEVAELIVQIWEHRHTVGFRDDPLALTESVERAVARLDPSAKAPFSYYRPFDEQPGPSPAEIEANTALRIALGIDDAAGDIVRSLVSYAAMIAENHDAEWVRTAIDARLTSVRRLTRWVGFDLEESAEDPHSTAAVRSEIAKRAQALGKALRLLSQLPTGHTDSRAAASR